MDQENTSYTHEHKVHNNAKLSSVGFNGVKLSMHLKLPRLPVCNTRHEAIANIHLARVHSGLSGHSGMDGHSGSLQLNTVLDQRRPGCLLG